MCIRDRFLAGLEHAGPALQLALWRLVEEGSFSPVGGQEVLTTNLRLIAGSGGELARRGADGAFRPDLYYALAVGELALPPLRARRGDVALLAQMCIRDRTSADADRIRATGARAIQINTGKGCHLDAHMVGHALDDLRPAPCSFLFIENVGNLVCPAGFDLGEDAKVAILSVTEGEDKPLKYPDMFTAARLAILNKCDLAPHCDADLDAYEANLRRVNPDIEILRLSARTGEGLSLIHI